MVNYLTENDLLTLEDLETRLVLRNEQTDRHVKKMMSAVMLCLPPFLPGLLLLAQRGVHTAFHLPQLFQIVTQRLVPLILSGIVPLYLR